MLLGVQCQTPLIVEMSEVGFSQNLSEIEWKIIQAVQLKHRSCSLCETKSHALSL